MSISLSAFNEAHQAKLGALPTRVFDFLENSDRAHSADEIAAALLGITNRYVAILSAEVREAVPAVQDALDELVRAGKLRSAAQWDGPIQRTYYAKRP